FHVTGVQTCALTIWFVAPAGAFVIGVAGAACAYLAAVKLKQALGYDDSLDVFGIHGVAGVVGAVLTGALATATVNPAADGAGIEIGRASCSGRRERR